MAQVFLKFMMLNLRNQQIDFLRGIAIFVVLLLHFNLAYRLDESALNKIFSVTFIQTLASNGNYGVTMFFVISGFLITATSLERYQQLGKINLIGFYILRFARIMPCLVLTLLLISAFNFCHISIFANDAHSVSFGLTILSILTFWHNVLMEKIGYFNYCLNIFWSLSVEEIFYLAFPILCFICRKNRFIILCMLMLIIFSPIYRNFYSNNEIIALYGYFSCFDAIAMGCCAALLAKEIELTGLMGKLVRYFAWILIITVYFYTGIMNNVVVGVSLVAFATAILLIGASKTSQPSRKNLLITTFSWLGKNSYELYLFHIIILALMKELFPKEALGDDSKLVWLIIFFTSSILVAMIITKFYSQPLNQKCRYFLNKTILNA